MNEYLEEVALWLREEAGTFGFRFYKERANTTMKIYRSCGDGRREPEGEIQFDVPLHVIAWGREASVIRADASVKILESSDVRQITREMDNFLKYVAQEFKYNFAVQIVKRR